MSKRLTDRQIERLAEIECYVPSEKWPNAAFWRESPTDRSLLKRGLIERADVTRQLGGGGSMGSTSVTWFGCKLTDAGKAALS